MKKRVYAFILVLIIIFTGVLFSACEHDKIKFYRESQVDNMMKKFSTKTSQPAKFNASGIIILKDESSNNSSINFGPSEINFDLPVKFK